MKILILLFLLPLTTFNTDFQDPAGSWVITTPCDCEGKDELSWKLTLKTDGTYDVDIDLNGIVEVTGRYWVDGDTIIVQNNNGCTAKGTYKFSIENDRLWMDPIEDACTDRKPPQKVFFTKA